MGNKASFPGDVKVVVVGAGYGGVNLASKLQSSGARFTLIDNRDCMHHNMAAVRAVIIPGFVKKTFLPLKPKFGDNFIQGKVVNVLPEQKQVKLASGETVSYDTLVLATGTTGPFPCKIKDHSTKEAIDLYNKLSEKVKKSKSVTVVGGGAAGVELASEIATEYPDTQVTLVHSRTQLVDYPKVTPQFQERLMETMKRFNIKMILGERVSNLNQFPVEGAAGTVLTDKGTKVTSDLVLIATGLKVNADAYQASGLASKMEPTGHLKVNEYLQVEGHDDIYALGDCNNVRENKLAFGAEKQAGHVFNNIAKQNSKQALEPYKPGSLPIAIVVALGREVGLGQFAGGTIIGEFMAKKMKAADVFVSSYWKKFGQPPPE